MPTNNSFIPSRQNWIFNRDKGEFDSALQLNDLAENEISMMFNRTFKMFDYEGLPDGITYKDMERFTQLKGKQFFIKHNGRYYILPGDFINEGLTWNYEASRAKIVNVALKDLKNEYHIGEDAILYPNDSNYQGLYELFKSRSVQIASCDISLFFAAINTRFKNFIFADDDDTVDSINKVMQEVIEGKAPRAIATSGIGRNVNEVVKDVPYNPTGQSSDIKDLIELRQYLKASWYMELGIDANYNMKREAINESEAHMNDEALLPLIDDMMMVRKNAIDEINKKFNLNISIEFSSSWKKLRDEIELSVEKEKAEVEAQKNIDSDEGAGTSDDKEGEQDEA